jgi:MFS transporter, DHA1 family, tetracycline resistance protein
MIPDTTGAGTPAPAAPANGWLARARAAVPLEPWFTPFTLVNGAGVGLSPILLPVVAARYGVGHVGLVMGAFNLGALAAPLAGNLADRLGAYRLLATVFTAMMAVALWLFPWVSPDVQVLLGLAEGAGFAAALTIGNLLIVERRPKAQWNVRLASLETTLGVGQAGALFLAAWLSGLGARSALGIGAIVPAAAIPLALVLIPRVRRGDNHEREASAPDPAGGPVLARRIPASIGHVGEWGPSPSRVHHAHRGFQALAEWPALLRGGFGWMLGAWIPAYAGTAIIFALYPVLFLHAFGISTTTSALAFAVIVFVSLPLYVVAGRVCQRGGPARTIARALASRVILLSALAVFAAVGHISAILPLACFAGVMFAWSFLSVASPALTGQLCPDAQGDAQGLLNAGSGLAGLLGSVAGGLIASQWGYSAALAAGAGAIALGLVIFTVTQLRRSHPKPAPEAA